MTRRKGIPGLNGVDPRREPNDLTIFLALIGWTVLLVYLIDLLVDWVCSLTWFV
jgi:hypothetical protein